MLSIIKTMDRFDKTENTDKIKNTVKFICDCVFKVEFDEKSKTYYSISTCDKCINLSARDILLSYDSEDDED